MLELLPEGVQPDILHRIARLGPITPEAVETLQSVLAHRIVLQPQARYAGASGASIVADALDTVPVPA